MSYYNTTRVSGGQLDLYESKAKSQEIDVLRFFQKHPTGAFSPEDVGRAVMPRAPRTSVGRALTNLTKEGYLIKTDRKVIGSYGRPIYLWELNLGRLGELR